MATSTINTTTTQTSRSPRAGFYWGLLAVVLVAAAVVFGVLRGRNQVSEPAAPPATESPMTNNAAAPAMQNEATDADTGEANAAGANAAKPTTPSIPGQHAPSGTTTPSIK